MSTATISRDSLHARLRAVALALMVRQVLRAAVSGVSAGGLGVLGGVLLLVALPWMLGMAFAAGAALAALFGAIGFVGGAALALSRTRMPDAQDAALALQARLGEDDGALATALQVREDSEFQAPVLRRAASALHQALRRPAPHLLNAREIVLAPLLALAAATALVWALGFGPVSVHAPRAAQPRPDTAFSIDLETGREADSEVVARAMGLKRARASLAESARTLRSETAAHNLRQASLEQARKAAESAPDAELRAAAGAMPQTAPSEQAEREALAARLEALAAGVGARAGETGTTESAGDLPPGAVRPERFVEFPRARRRDAVTPPVELAAQTPERRALAERAMAELERAR